MNENYFAMCQELQFVFSVVALASGLLLIAVSKQEKEIRYIFRAVGTISLLSAFLMIGLTYLGKFLLK